MYVIYNFKCNVFCIIKMNDNLCYTQINVVIPLPNIMVFDRHIFITRYKFFFFMLNFVCVFCL